MARDESNVHIDHLATIRVFAGPGQQLLLGQLWKNQTAVIVFLRHFACIACRAHAAEVWRDRAKYEVGGAKIVFLGNGQPEWIEKFREDLGIEKGVVLTDPSLASFKAAGFKNGFFSVVQPKSVINMVKLAQAGHVQKATDGEQGPHLQLGGILVVSSAGKVIYRYVSKAIGDFPEEPHAEIIAQDESGSL